MSAVKIKTGVSRIASTRKVPIDVGAGQDTLWMPMASNAMVGHAYHCNKIQCEHELSFSFPAHVLLCSNYSSCLRH